MMWQVGDHAVLRIAGPFVSGPSIDVSLVGEVVVVDGVDREEVRVSTSKGLYVVTQKMLVPVAEFKVRYHARGGHVRCTVFCTPRAGGTWADCGTLIVRKEDFGSLRASMPQVTFQEQRFLSDGLPDHPAVPDHPEVTCKGSWVLGTACGKCGKCAEEAVALMPKLLKVEKAFDVVRALALATAESSPEFKTASLAEIRQVVGNARR